MSTLPAIDPLKVAERKIQKLSAELAESKDIETRLEILAEALRDERDEARAKAAELEAAAVRPEQVEDITSL
jgi:hypothetical protein